MKKEIKPPVLADRLFERYCRNAQIEDLHGDVEELFYLNLKTMPIWKAKVYYWRQVFSLMFSYAVKRRKKNASTHAFASHSINLGMVSNYFLIASRSLVKNKFFSIINIIGLAVGMSVCLLLISFFSFITTYDDFHAERNNIYRVISKTNYKTELKEWASAPSFLAHHLKNDHTGIDEVVRVNASLNSDVEIDNNKIPISGYYVDPNFLSVFTYPLVTGNKDMALQKPNTIVITERAVKKLFGDVNPVGEAIKINNVDFEITGVLEDHPKNSHMQFEALASYQSIEKGSLNGADNLSLSNLKEFRDEYIYLLLPNAKNIHQLESYLNKQASKANGIEGYNIAFELQKLEDITPGRALSNSIGPAWDIQSLSAFIFIALLILLPASFNYANISIAQSLKRMKEIGLRKMMGGLQQQIFLQFIIETIIISLISLGLSFYLFTLIRQEFLAMLVSGDAISLDLNMQTILYFVVFAVLVGLVTGFVPAYYFSKLNPVQAMKKTPVRKASGFAFRKSLTVFQFVLSIVFITTVVIQLSQYRQTINYDFGFQQENILDVQLQESDPDLLRNEFSKLSSVAQISMSSNVLGVEGVPPVFLKNLNGTDSIKVFQMFIDEYYLSNLGLTLVAGRNFTSNKLSNNKIIVNESFLEKIGINDPSLALGQLFTINDQPQEVIGVVLNFHYAPLDQPIESFMFRYDVNQFRVANVKVASNDMLETLTEMDAIWRMLGGEKKFIAHFFEEEIEEAYSNYFVLVKLCGFLGFLAITISCLGLLGMVVLTVDSKIKEIGIRKVMGASTHGMVVMLSKDFIKLIFIASCIALPITYLFFDQVYMRTQYYKIPIGATEILISLGIIMSFGFFTILSQTMRAAQANPVDTLRSE